MATLEQMLEQAKSVKMTEEEEEEARRSFAYGNTKLSNPNITRKMVDEAADKIDRKFTGGLQK